MHEQWASKFWARVCKGEPATGCWTWTGSRLPKGYGRFYPATGIGLYAHRFSWELANGREVPAGLEVMHSCDNPPCVRPDHLSVGTRTDNARDCKAKGRHKHAVFNGEDVPSSKLTEVQVREIRALWSSGVRGQREIAARFGVSKSEIGNIVRREVWR